MKLQVGLIRFDCRHQQHQNPPLTSSTYPSSPPWTCCQPNHIPQNSKIDPPLTPHSSFFAFSFSRVLIFLQTKDEKQSAVEDAAPPSQTDECSR